LKIGAAIKAAFFCPAKQAVPDVDFFFFAATDFAPNYASAAEPRRPNGSLGVATLLRQAAALRQYW